MIACVFGVIITLHTSSAMICCDRVGRVRVQCWGGGGGTILNLDERCIHRLHTKHEATKWKDLNKKLTPCFRNAFYSVNLLILYTLLCKYILLI